MSTFALGLELPFTYKDGTSICVGDRISSIIPGRSESLFTGIVVFEEYSDGEGYYDLSHFGVQVNIDRGSLISNDRDLITIVDAVLNMEVTKLT